MLPGNAVSAQWQGRTFFLALHSPEAQKPIEATAVTGLNRGLENQTGCDNGFMSLYAISLVSSWQYCDDVGIVYTG